MRKVGLAAILLVMGLEAGAQEPAAEAAAGPKLPPGVAETQGLANLPDLQKNGRISVPLSQQPAPQQAPIRPPTAAQRQAELHAPIGQIGEGPTVSMPKGDKAIDTKEAEEHTRRMDRLYMMDAEASLWAGIVKKLGGDHPTTAAPTQMLSGSTAMAIEPPAPIAEIIKKEPIVAKPIGWRAYKVVRMVRREGRPAAVVDLDGARYEVAKDSTLGPARVVDVTFDCVTVALKAEQIRKCAAGEE